jgi:Ca2+-binding RTX toxin-like protein
MPVDRLAGCSKRSGRPQWSYMISLTASLLVLLAVPQTHAAGSPPGLRSPFSPLTPPTGSRQSQGRAAQPSPPPGSRIPAAEAATGSYSDSVLADGPVGYWEMNELLGPVAFDATGSHNGTYGGTPLLGLPGLVSYPGNLAPRMDGSDDRVNANSMASGVDWSQGFTLEIWVDVQQTSAEEHAIAFNTSAGGNGPALLRDEPTDAFKYRDGDPGSGDYHYASSSTVGRVGGTYHLVVTVHRNDQGELYVNGSREASFNTPARPPATGGLFTIGAEYDAGPTPESFWHGPLDEAAVYNYALSASRVQAHWLAGSEARMCPGYEGDPRNQIVGTDGPDNLTGTSGDDILCGLGGDDTLLGGAGDDRLYGGTGDDTFNGGAGDDTVFFSEAPAASAVAADLTGAPAICGPTQVPCAENDQLGHDTFVTNPLTGLSTVESLTGTRYGDFLRGDAQLNQLLGAGGDDSLIGGGANDILIGGGGGDSLSGGNGNDFLLPGEDDDPSVDGGVGDDILSYVDVTSGVTVTLTGGGTADTRGAAGTDTVTGIEIAAGSPQADTLIGDGDDDVLMGLAGNDILSGADGADTLGGGEGDDSIDGGAGFDISSYSLSPGGVNVDLRGNPVSDGTGGSDTLASIESVSGSDTGADTIVGDGADNYLLGLGGGDDLSGWSGDDALDGGDGTDTLDGGTGSDTCINGENVSHCELAKAAATDKMHRVVHATNLSARTERALIQIVALLDGMYGLEPGTTVGQTRN